MAVRIEHLAHGGAGCVEVAFGRFGCELAVDIGSVFGLAAPVGVFLPGGGKLQIAIEDATLEQVGKGRTV